METSESVKNCFPINNSIPDDCKLTSPVHQQVWLVNGELRPWLGAVQEVYSPILVSDPAGPQPRLLGSYPLLGEKEAVEALQSAVAAYGKGRGQWCTMSVEQRIEYIEQFVSIMKQKRAEVVRLLMWEIAKTRSDAEKEFDRTVDYIRDTVDALKSLDRISSRFQIEQGIIGQIRRAPLGVVLCMGPYNYPLNETFTTLIPALIMGNTVIFKPPKFGVLLHFPLLEAFRDVFPPGVVNTVYGDGQMVITPIIASGDVDVLAFIGSSRVARILQKQHPKPNRLRSILGLEAKNAAIVLPDANLPSAVKECVLGSLSYNGQRCTALKILFVHRDIVQQFMELFNNELAALKIGMPWEDGVSITPLPDTSKVQYMKELVEDARKLGASVVNPGGGEANGTMFYPAVVYPVDERMRLFQEEQFGPVVPIAIYDDIEIPISFIVDSNYGQQVSIFGEDPGVIAELVDHLVNQVCRVNVNSQCQRGPDTFPFTGRKDSAEGTLSVSDALRCFSIRTLVAAKQTEQNESIITDIVRERRSSFLSTDFIF